MSMGIDLSQFLAMEARVKRNTKTPQPEQIGTPCEDEDKLSNEIKSFCYDQWPRWKVIQARSDKRSGIAKGCQDMTIFASEGRVFCFELKKKTGKLSDDQRDWHQEMKMIGHTVHTIRSYDEFLHVLNL